MPVDISDADVFTNPIVAPADSDPADRTYVLTIAQGLANRTRYLFSRMTPPTAGRTLRLHGSAFRPFPLSGAGTMPLMGVGTGGGYRLLLNNELTGLVLPLNRLLPDGAKVTKVDVMIRPATKSTPGKLELWWLSMGFDTVPPTVSNTLAGDAATSGTAMQLLTIVPTFSYVIGQSNTVQYLTYVPNSISGGGSDIIEAIRITFDDVSARNF